jgi:TP901 family phage tail tape measure protein
MSIRVNIGTSFDASDIQKARKELDALEGSLSGISEKLLRTSRGFQNTGRVLGGIGTALTSAVTLPLVGVGVAATTMAANFSESMSKITALVGIAADEVKAMESSVLSLSRETAKSPQELADALFVVTSAGLRGAQAMEALNVAAKAGAAGLGATNDIARVVAGAMNAYGAETLGAARATDIIVATARAGNFATDQFAGALGRVLPFAKQAQASLEDVGGAVALLTRTNGNAAESITQVRALFGAFVVPTREAQTVLEEVGVSAEDLRNKIGKDGLVSALQLLDRAVGGNREVLGRLLGSKEAASAAFQILDADAESLAGTFGVVADSIGMTDDAFNTASEQSAFKFREALNNIRIAGIELGNTILPIVTDILEAFLRLTERFDALEDSQKKMIVVAGLLLAALGPLLIILGSVATIIGVLIAAGLPFAAAIGAVVAGVALLGGALAFVGFKAFAKEVTEADKALQHEARAAEHAARGHHALADAERERARQARAAQSRLDQDLELGRMEIGLRSVAASTDAVTDATEDAADAIDELGSTSGNTGPKIVALSSSMRLMLQELNDVHASAGDSGAVIAQFARELLAAGNITDQVSRGAEKLAQTIRANLDRALADANRRLDEAKQKLNQYRDAIAGGIRRGNTLSDAVSAQDDALRAVADAQRDYNEALKEGDEASVNKTAKALKDAKKAQSGFVGFLQVGAQTAEGFADQIDALRAAGASLEVVQQIAELGARTGGRVVAELLAGGAEAIAQANTLVAAVEAAAARAGEGAAQQFFSAGVRSAKRFVDAIEATIPELQSVLDQIADMIERALGVRPQVDLSGRPQFIAPGPATPGSRPSPASIQAAAGRTAAQRAEHAMLGRTFDPRHFESLMFMANGGVVTGPTLAMIGEAGPEAVIPLDRMGGMGTNVVINVSGADPQAVVEALRRYTRANGPLGSVVSI